MKTPRPSAERLKMIRTEAEEFKSQMPTTYQYEMELFAEIDALNEEKEQWGNEFTAVCLAKEEREAWKVYAVKLREALKPGCYCGEGSEVFYTCDCCEALSIPMPGEKD